MKFLQSDQIIDKKALMETTFISVDGVAKILQVSSRSVQKMFDNGHLSGFRLKVEGPPDGRRGAGDRRIRLASLIGYLTEVGLNDVAAEIVAGRPRVFVGSVPEDIAGPLQVECSLVGAMSAVLESFLLPEEVIIDTPTALVSTQDLGVFLQKLTIRAGKFKTSIAGRSRDRRILDRCRIQVAVVLASDLSAQRRGDIVSVLKRARGLSDEVIRPCLVEEADRDLPAVAAGKCVWPEL